MQSGFNIERFRSIVMRNGVMRPSKFLVRIPTPIGMLGSQNSGAQREISRNLELFCDSAALPGVSLSTWEHTRYGYGPFEKRPVRAGFTDINLNFWADGNGAIRAFFQNWIGIINNFDARAGMDPARTTGLVRGIEMSTYEESYKYEYMVDLEVIAFKDNGDPALKYIFREAFPLFLGDNQLDWGQQNAIMKIPVNFTFFDWYADNPSETDGIVTT